eukprot:g4892.t1
MLLGSDAEAARSSLYRQVKKANKEASKRRRDEKKSNKSRLRQLNREIRMIEKLLEKNVPTIDYTPEQNKKRLVKLKIERDNIIKKMSNPTIADYQKMFEASKAQKSKDRSARIKVFSASRRNRLRTSALERVRPAKHTSAYNPMRTNANDIIMRPFTGLGPSEKGKPLQLKADALWPVLPGRGTDRIPGAKPWYRTKNGRIFGEQTLEEMPKKYRDTVIRNKAIRERNEKYMQARAKRRSVIQAALDASAKPRRPWTAPPGVNRIFSQVPPLRPPTDQENKKIAKLKVPDRSDPGHRLPGYPAWR